MNENNLMSTEHMSNACGSAVQRERNYERGRNVYYEIGSYGIYL